MQKEEKNENQEKLAQEEMTTFYQKSNSINIQRLMSLVLAEAFVRYREGHYREDIEDYKESVIESMQNYDGKKDKGWEKRALKKLEFLVVEKKKKEENINRIMTKLVEEVNGKMSDENQKRFDNYVAGVSILIEEFIKAKNTTEMLTLCKLYNQGLLDGVFSGVKQEDPKQTEETSTEETNHLP